MGRGGGNTGQDRTRQIRESRRIALVPIYADVGARDASLGMERRAKREERGDKRAWVPEIWDATAKDEHGDSCRVSM